MKSFDCIITDEVGIHARPAGMLVKEAKGFQSVIRLACKGKEAEATKLMAIMGLGARKGDKITVTAEGEDENVAIAAMKRFFEENL